MNLGIAGSNRVDPSRCECIRPSSTGLACSWPILFWKKEEGSRWHKELLDITKVSANWFLPLKSALSGVNAIIEHYEMLIRWVVILQT